MRHEPFCESCGRLNAGSVATLKVTDSKCAITFANAPARTPYPANAVGDIVRKTEDFSLFGCRNRTRRNVLMMQGHHRGDRTVVEEAMGHPIVHAEIRSADPDATRAFFGSLFGWTYPAEGAFPGYTFVETGVPGALYTAISPLQGGDDLVTFFVGVQNIEDTISDAIRLGGRVVQESVTVPGVAFAVIADPQGHAVGLAQQLEPAPAKPQ